MLYEAVPNLILIQTNTDGITTVLDRDKLDVYYDVCREWEILSRMTLEYAEYRIMYIRDVNNYIAINTKGKIKLKGAYEIDKELHKDNSMKIVPIAVLKYLEDKVQIEETIKRHDNILDFCKRHKGNRSFENQYHSIKDNKKYVDILAKNIRYFVSIGNGSLYKSKLSGVAADKLNMSYFYKQGLVFDDDELDGMRKDTSKAAKLTGIEAGKSVTIFNKRYNVPMKEYRIDYNYYIKEAMKLVEPFIYTNNKLF